MSKWKRKGIVAAIALMVVISGLLVTWSVARSQTGPARLRVEPQGSRICNIDETIEYSVVVENAMDIWSYDIYFNFTPGTLEISNLRNGDFLTKGWLITSINNAEGYFNFANVQLSGNPVSGSGVLMRFDVTCKAPPGSLLTLRQQPNFPILGRVNGEEDPVDYIVEGIPPALFIRQIFFPIMRHRGP